MEAQRIFLGWDQLPLHAVVDWLQENYGTDLGACWIALPGARAGRRLLELLAQRMPASWTPPRWVTVGGLTDELLELSAPVADRMLRTLVWEQALRRLSPARLERLVAEPPAAEDGAGWRRLAVEVRTLFGELAAEGVDFAAVAQGPAADAGGEEARWAALADAQAFMERALQERGLCDPHLGRRDALDAGRVITGGRQVILVGVSEMNRLTRGLLERLPKVRALVLAPESEAPRFDALGCVRPQEWAHRHSSLPMQRWHVVSEPVDEARQAIDCLRELDGSHCAEEITMGVADEAVTPYLERQLVAQGLAPREAMGRAFLATSVGRLLSGLHELLTRPAFRPWAALLRHPDLERALVAGDGQPLPADLADRYAGDHAPWRLDGKWRADSEDPSAVRRQARLQRIDQRLRALFGALALEEERSPQAWAQPLRAFLDAVLGAQSYDPEGSQAEWDQIEALRAVGAVLQGLEGLPPAEVPVSAASAMDLVLAELIAVRIPPRPRRPSAGARLAVAEQDAQPSLFAEEPAAEVLPGEPSGVVELLGWLELPLDDAPVLVVTGFDEGCVPDRLRSEAWLPDSLRTRLGLPDQTRRLARDTYAVELLCHSRRVSFISSRRSVEGDPKLPSRIALQRPPEELPGRLQRLFLEDRVPRRGKIEVGRAHELPFVVGLGREPEYWSATAIAEYLSSPYKFWLNRCLRLKTWEDDHRELTPLAFGNLAHKVLEDFGRSKVAYEVQAERIAAYLSERLAHHAEERFGPAAEPAVRLQVEQLNYRLSIFAKRQASETRSGWRIEEVEWVPNRLSLDLGDFESASISEHTRIDRIDRHTDGRWRILDYKTGEASKSPDQAHRNKGEWRSVQLPLYQYLTRDFTGDAEVQLGYVTLGAAEKDVGFQFARWTMEDVEQAVQTARGVILEVRRKLAEGERFELGSPYEGEPLYAPLFGTGLAGGTQPEEVSAS